MVIIGAKGFAKEVLEVLHQSLHPLSKIAFFDDVNTDLPDLLFGEFRILKNKDDVLNYFNQTDKQFTLGIGGPINRAKLAARFENWGGVLTSVISPKANIGSFNVTLESGLSLMTGTTLTSDIIIKKGSLINLHCTVGHDSTIGRFVELSPGVHVSGRCTIGDYCNLGTNATLLPEITLGENVVVGAGAVVSKDVPSNSVVVGIPAKIIKELPPIVV